MILLPLLAIVGPPAAWPAACRAAPADCASQHCCESVGAVGVGPGGRRGGARTSRAASPRGGPSCQQTTRASKEAPIILRACPAPRGCGGAQVLHPSFVVSSVTPQHLRRRNVSSSTEDALRKVHEEEPTAERNERHCAQRRELAGETLLRMVNTAARQKTWIRRNMGCEPGANAGV